MGVLDVILSLGPWILDKISPGISEKVIPPVEITPKNFNLGGGDWSEQISFSVQNKRSTPLFDIYIMIEIGNAKSEDFKIKTDGLREIDNEAIDRNTLLNTRLIKFNITRADN